MDGVLEHARTVAEREEMPDPHFRNAVSVALGDDRINWGQYSSPGVFARALEDCEIALGRLLPRHRSACRIRTFAHGVTTDVVCQQTGDLGAQGFDIPKRNQNAA